MISTGFSRVVVSFTAVILLCSCNKNVQFTELTEAVSESSTGTPSVPNTPTTPTTPTTPPSGGGNAATKTACELFLEQLKPVDLNATVDRTVTAADPGWLNLDKIRNLSVLRYSSELRVQSAVMISTVSGMTGPTYLNAGRIGAITGQTGAICARAAQIDQITQSMGGLTLDTERVLQLSDIQSSGLTITVSGQIDQISVLRGAMNITAKNIGPINDIQGTISIRAESIASINETLGTIHIYGAKVGNVTDISGRIYLHEGATVANPNNKVIRVD